MARIISISNQKGGVGKTTTAINLSACLASQKRRVLLIDLDPQGNATSGIGLSKDDIVASGYQVLLGRTELSTACQSTRVPNLTLVGANRDLIGIEIELVREDRREFRLKDALQSVSTSYDYILIDCPPSVGLLTINALTASHSVLIPLQCEYFAMEGLGELIRTLQRVKAHLNPLLEREGILLTMYDGRNRLSRQVGDEVRRLFGALVFNTVIPRNVRLGESPSFGQPIHAYDPRSSGAVAYSNLAKELILRHDVSVS